MKALFVLLPGILCAQAWAPINSGTTANLRGLSVVNDKVAWASGAKGTFLKTTDGGLTWTVSTMPGAADLDFRDIEAIDERTVYLMSAGPGPLSRVYKTKDAGANWSLLATNLDPKGFWDCMSFWDESHGIIVGDPVNGRFTIMTTRDGFSWQTLKGPPANKDEALFAASGTCVFTRGTREAWFGTGGLGGARVFHTTDGGDSWSVSQTPMRHDSANAGIFSLAFSDALHGMAVGGDYAKPQETAGNIAMTTDGGKTWTTPTDRPGGYRSAITYRDKSWIAVGTSGSDIATGSSFRNFSPLNLNAVKNGLAVGPNGTIATWK